MDDSLHNGRLSNGRFTAGNAFARGNPHAKRVAQLRSALIEAVSEADIREAVAVLMEKVRAGDVVAIRELFDRVLGKPVQADLLEIIEQLCAYVESKRSK